MAGTREGNGRDAGRELQGCGKSIAVRSTRRLAGGIQAKEEVRYDSLGRGFQ